MAGTAFQIFMAAGEWEFGLDIVIVFPKIPAVWIVALTAFFSQPSLMLIILRMTFDATQGGLCVRLGPMTRFTGQHGVQADQRETGKIMVENDLLAPAPIIMALFALFSLPSIMDVIFFMTEITGGF